MVRAASRSLDLRTRPVRRAVVSVVMVVVAPHPLGGPAQGRHVREGCGGGTARHHDALVEAVGDGRDACQRTAFRQGRHDLLALAAHHDVDVELAERRLGRDGAVRPDRDGAPASASQQHEELARHAQLRLCAAPEQIGRGGRHYRHVGPERRDCIREVRERRPEERPV